MTPTILAWLKSIKAVLPSKPSILEVGALNVNGSPRSVFTNYGTYLGIDRRAGPGVDIVLDSHDLLTHFKERKFDVVICCEMLEHDPDPLLTVKQMTGLLDTGGFMIISSPGNGFKEHPYPRDYWRIMPHTYKDVIFAGFEIMFEHRASDKSGSYCICVLGRKN